MLNRHWDKLKAQASVAELDELNVQSNYEAFLVQNYMRALGLDFSQAHSLLEKSGLVLSFAQLNLPDSFSSVDSVERVVLRNFFELHPYRIIVQNCDFPLDDVSGIVRRSSKLFSFTPFSVASRVSGSDLIYEFPYAYARDSGSKPTTLIRLE